MRSDPHANVLLVDDQPAKLLSYRVILEGLDANLVSAHSAREALDWLLKSEFAAVLVDVCMPDLDGFELARMIRDHPRFRNTAIIFVSGVALTELDRMRGYECGAVDYLPVPVVPEILRAKVSAFVELHRKTRQLEELNRELEAASRRAYPAARRSQPPEGRVPGGAGPRASQPARCDSHGGGAHRPARCARIFAQPAAGVIRRQVAHLGRLVDDLVDVSRITRGLIELQRERLNVGSIVRQAVEMSQPTIAERGHMLEISPIGEDLEVFGRSVAADAGRRQHPAQRREVHPAGRPDPTVRRA